MTLQLDFCLQRKILTVLQTQKLDWSILASVVVNDSVTGEAITREEER